MNTLKNRISMIALQWKEDARARKEGIDHIGSRAKKATEKASCETLAGCAAELEIQLEPARRRRK